MKNRFWHEARILLSVSLPLVFAYLSDVLMLVIAKSVIGKLGHVELAAAGLSTDLSYEISIILMGFFSVVGVQVSVALGARRRGDAVPDLVQALGLACVLGLITAIAVYNFDWFLGVFGQSVEVVEAARPFCRMLAFAILPIVWFGVLRSFVSAFLRTGLVMGVTVLAVGLTYVLMWGLVHGSFGMPRMGVAGAGLAWSIIMWSKLAVLAVYTVWLVRRESLPLNPQQWFTSFAAFGPLVSLGLPVAGIVALESGLFAATALLSGTLGTVELAAYQMMLAWIAIPFVISLGLSEATMVRVAYWTGVSDMYAARRAGLLGMTLGVGIPLILIAVPLAAPWLISDTFLDRADPAFPAIAALVAKLLFIAAIFQVFDGLQVIASHALRGLRDAAVPLVIAGVGYWVIGLGLAYVLCFPLAWRSEGLWWGLAVGLAVTAVLLAARFERLSRPGSIAAVVSR